MADQHYECPICGKQAKRIITGTISMKEYFLSRSQYRIASGARDFFDLYKCHGCGHGFFILEVPGEVISSWYAKAPADSKFLAEQATRRHTARRVLKRIIKHLPQKGRLLDVGAGPGLFVQEAQRKGFEAVGLEPSDWAVEWGRRELKLQSLTQGGYKSLSQYGPDSFDVLTAFDVIEHIVDPEDFIRECARVVRPGGYIVLTTPRFDSWLARTMGSRWYCLLPAHLHYFTTTSLSKVLAREGFEITNSRHHTRYLSLDYFVERVMDFAGWTKPDFLVMPSRWNVPVNFGDEFEIYAQKKLK